MGPQIAVVRVPARRWRPRLRVRRAGFPRQPRARQLPPLPAERHCLGGESSKSPKPASIRRRPTSATFRPPLAGRHRHEGRLGRMVRGDAVGDQCKRPGAGLARGRRRTCSIEVRGDEGHHQSQCRQARDRLDLPERRRAPLSIQPAHRRQRHVRAGEEPARWSRSTW